MSILFSNNASGTLSVQALPADLTLTLQTNEGQLFPSPTGGDFCFVSLEDSSGNVEICRCTGRSGDVLTVTRAQDNTSAKTFAVGSRVEVRLNAAAFDEFLQATGDVMSGNLDMNGNELQDALITTTGSSVIQGIPIRGSDNGTANQLIVPSGGASPTIGGDTILTTGNDSAYVQTTRNLTGGEGIGTIGDLSADRTVDLAVDELTAIQGNALADTDTFLVYDTSAAEHKQVEYKDAGLRINTEATTSRVLAAADMNTYVRCTAGTAVTISLNTGVGVQGNVVILEQAGAGTVTVAGTASVNTAFTSQSTREQYSVIILICYANNSWTLYGDVD